MVGSIDPYQLFRIFHELVGAMRDETDIVARDSANRVVYMLDQCHNIEPKIPAMIRSVMTSRRRSPGHCSWTRRPCTPRRKPATCWRRTGPAQDAYQTDVRPMLAELRRERGLPEDPYRAYLGQRRTRGSARPSASAASPPAGESTPARSRHAPTGAKRA